MEQASSSLVQAVSARFAPSARKVALAAERSLLNLRIGSYAATLHAITTPTQRLTELPALGWSPMPLYDPQPTIQVGVLGGSQPSLGRCMVDSGSGFTLTTTTVVKEHGLQMRPFYGNYQVANGTQSRLVGEVDMDL
jgi:hypothetical protein